MKMGDLFTSTHVETRPCVNCDAPAVELDDGTMHFEVTGNGGKTAWPKCFTIVRGRRKYTGTTAAVA